MIKYNEKYYFKFFEKYQLIENSFTIDYYQKFFKNNYAFYN